MQTFSHLSLFIKTRSFLAIAMTDIPEPIRESAAIEMPPRNASVVRNPVRDLRATVRYSLRARVVFTWSDGQGRGHEGEGFTQNISRRGVFVLGASCPAKGDRITLAIFLPALASETRELRIDAVGRVLRVEHAKPPADKTGFAVSHESINMCAA